MTRRAMDAANSNKYVRIDPRYRLAGWLRQPYAVVDGMRAQAHFVPQDVFDTLRMCNGRFKPSDPVFLGQRKAHLAALERDGVLAFSDEPGCLEPGQEYRLYPNRYMRTVLWSITGRCNYRCRHCYMNAPSAPLPQASTEECLRIADQMAEAGIQTVRLTGGECLVRNDLLQVIDRLMAGGVQIETILTNGALVTEELLRALEEHGVRCGFDISFDGTGGRHDWLRGVEGAERAAIRAFELCREHGFPTGAEMCLHEGNKHTLRESIRHMGSLGVRSVKTNPVADVGAWREGGYGESISMPDTYQLYLDYIPHYYEDGMPLDVMLGGFFWARPSEPDRFDIPSYKPPCEPSTMCMCGHARHVMYISPEGRALPCMALSGMAIQDEFPLITEQGLQKCITDSRYMRLIDTRASEYFELHEDCRNCKYALCCYGGCRADALATDEDDIMGKSMGSCELFRGGWVEKVIEAVKEARPTATSPVLDNPLWSDMA